MFGIKSEISLNIFFFQIFLSYSFIAIRYQWEKLTSSKGEFCVRSFYKLPLLKEAGDSPGEGKPVLGCRAARGTMPRPQLPIVSSFSPASKCPGELLLPIFVLSLLCHFLLCLHNCCILGAATKVQAGLKPDTSKTVPVWRAVCHIPWKHLLLSVIQMLLVLEKHCCVCLQVGRWKVSHQLHPAGLAAVSPE